MTPLPTVSEVHIHFTRGCRHLMFDALDVDKFDVDKLGGVPFMEANDISLRPSKHEIRIASDPPIL
ncbi:hypothetical protein DPMN_180260 [Dreissena polymorpha]|uniref:Uncharacterized protein n=1 Tax=Dreissena polymorpha TaxID=45954 RepID=A0A9D4IMZ9_DREPO|nr:hypothetical protein DPMN_180260 [Dreissena polymorpha]